MPCIAITNIMESGVGQGQAVLLFLFDSILRLFYFTPRCLVDETPWTRKAQQIGDENDFFKFSFISWVQQPFYECGNFPWI